MTTYFKIWDIWGTILPEGLKINKFKIQFFSLVLYPNSLPGGLYGSICSYYICISLLWYHTEAPWPFISKVGNWGKSFTRRLENRKFKIQFCFFSSTTPKYITRWVIWIHLFILYGYHCNGIIQKPHDHLFQKLGHLGQPFYQKAGK